jgi:hypothetical protein
MKVHFEIIYTMQEITEKEENIARCLENGRLAKNDL